MPASQAFQSFPTSSFTCVTLASDTDSEIGCKLCNTNSLTSSLFEKLNSVFSFNQQSTPSVCKLTRSDGLTTAYCSQQPNGNRPQVSFSCYQGTFSAEVPLQSDVNVFHFGAVQSLLDDFKIDFNIL